MSSGDMFADSKEAESSEGREAAEDNNEAAAESSEGREAVEDGSEAAVESLDLLAETDSEVTNDKEDIEQADVEMSEDVAETKKPSIDEAVDDNVSGTNEEAVDDPDEGAAEVSQEGVEEAGKVSQEVLEDDSEAALTAAGDGGTPEKAADKLFRFPQGTIKRIMKLDPEVSNPWDRDGSYQKLMTNSY